MNAALLRTACYDWHVAHGGKMVDFAGWEMPVQYTSIVAEHQAVRQAMGLFDVAHMGRLKFTGADAGKFLDQIVTNDILALEEGQVCYALIANQQGGVLDDVLVYRLPDFYLMVVNASNRAKIVNWVTDQRGGFRFEVEDLTVARFMLALQGPRAQHLLQPLVDFDLSSLNHHRAAIARVMGQPGLVSRTGYTGEDGFEVIVDQAGAPRLWTALADHGADDGLLPAGLGCRDTLRLEAGMPLYGHELDESIDPFTAGLGFAVKLDSGDFIGRDALRAARENANRQRRVGLVFSGKRIAREGAGVLSAGAAVGRVTSGGFSPTLNHPIAMAYVAPTVATAGTVVEVDIRGKSESAQVVRLPFYRRT